MDQCIVSETKQNIKKTWEDLFSLADLHDRDKKLTDVELSDPKNPVTILILYIFQIQCFILPAINRATQIKDLTKVKTLGPFDYALD